MGIGVCVLLLAGGAVLTFATDVSLSGVDLNTVGIILMLAGALGLVVTIGLTRAGTRPESTVPAAHQGPYPQAAAPYSAPAPDPYGSQPQAGQYPPSPGYAPREYR